MPSNRRSLLWIFILAPLTAYASGGYVLPGLLITFAVFVVVMTTIFKLSLQWQGKSILIIAYIIAMFVLFWGIDQVDYLKNLTLINLSCLLFPPAVVLLTYFAIRNKFSKP